LAGERGVRFREAQENAPVSQDNRGSKVLTGQKIKQCFEIASTTSRLRKSRYGIPCDETCEFIAEIVGRKFSELGTPAIENPHLDGITKIQVAEDAIKALLDKYEREKQRPYNWRDLAGWISVWGIHGWREEGKFPRSAEPEGPMCLFVKEVLATLGIHKEPNSISDVLKGRRGRRELKTKKAGQFFQGKLTREIPGHT
jgi:hypothetical protein